MRQETDDLRHYAIEVKPVGAACNLRCAYCYYLGKEKVTAAQAREDIAAQARDKTADEVEAITDTETKEANAAQAIASPAPHKSAVMTDDVLEAYIRQVLAIHGRQAEVEFAWHGGEPTLAGIDFYRKAVEIERRYGQGRRILNTLQTNGTLLDDDWCSFFHDSGFRIGLSIDGPADLHNAYRLDVHGRGTFDQVMRGLDLLRSHRVAFNTLTTVNAVNAEHAADVYRFLRDYTDFMQFLPVVEREDDSHVGNVSIPPGIYTPADGDEAPRTYEAPFNVGAEAYGRFLCTVLDEWARLDVGRKFVQVIEATVGNMNGRPAGLCVHESVCGHCAVVEKEGDVYRCDRYVFPHYRVGNIMRADLGDMMQTNRAFGEYKFESLPTDCLHCDVANLCWGGCPKDRLVEKLSFYGKERANVLCKGYRTFFRYAKARLPRILNPKKPII